MNEMCGWVLIYVVLICSDISTKDRTLSENQRCKQGMECSMAIALTPIRTKSTAMIFLVGGGGLFNIAMEHGPFHRWWLMIYPFKVVVFHSYVKLPEGISISQIVECYVPEINFQLPWCRLT